MSVRAIARQLGLSATAVSLALRGSPRVSAAVRARVEKAARAAGHVPNARLTELMREVRQSAAPQYRGTLGALWLFPEEEPWRERPIYEHLGLLLEGARARAEAHGYRLENFWLKAPGMTPRRLAEILAARGIRGVFCLGSLDPEERFPAALRRFAVVTQGVSIPEEMHRVVSHFTADARTLWGELQRRGYRRPGLGILVSGDRRTDHLYSATFLSEQERAGTAAPVPILRAETWDEGEFARWFDAHRPDAIVLHQYADYVRAAEAFLARRKLRVPRDVGLALLDKIPDRARYAGICQDPVRIGAMAAELLLGRLLLHDLATPEYPKVELVVGAWNEGTTLRGVGRGKGE
jgi:DNA-binding LacI/PurR family transcriptional regulator